LVLFSKKNTFLLGKSASLPNPAAVSHRELTRRALLGYSAAFAVGGKPIVVASKIDTEGALLGNLIAQTLRAHGMNVETRLQVGPTAILRQALLSGAIDIYPEYTGNAARFFHREGDRVWHDPRAAWQAAHDLDLATGLVWLAPAPANNGWGIAVRKDLAARVRPASLAGLAHYLNRAPDQRSDGPAVKLAASVEFVESPDALPAFERAYGFRLRQDQMIALAGGDTAATIRAAAEGISCINAAMAYTTDGAIDALGLVLLADPLHAQIVFQPAPVIRAGALLACPGIEPWLAEVFARLTLPVLRGLNARIAVQGEDPAKVAAAFLSGHA
jgi:osmoprotectant transport system substrate-binding protein